jgi:competence protein ComEA
VRDERDDAVTTRLWSILPEPPAGPVAVPESAVEDGGTFTDSRPVTWSGLMPSWPADVELPGDDRPRPPVVTPSSRAPIDPAAWAAVRPAWGDPDRGPAPRPSATGPPGEPHDDHGLSAAGAFDTGRFAAFDPGRRGVKALAAVAVLVVLIAAFLAWRARPRVEPVPPSVVAEGPLLPHGPAAPAAAPSTAAEVVVAVEGKVGKPGVVRLPAGARVADALAAAGGARAGVDVALLNLARKVVDGELILVGVTPPPGSTVAAGPAAPAAAGGPVNLNTATLADLDTLPGVGPVLAQRIIDARTAQGGFRAVSDLRKVEGIGSARYEQLKDLVTV